MFNAQAFISTIVFIVFLVAIYAGAMFFAYHKWLTARAAGAIVAMLSIAGLVSHVCYLIAGA